MSLNSQGTSEPLRYISFSSAKKKQKIFAGRAAAEISIDVEFELVCIDSKCCGGLPRGKDITLDPGPISCFLIYKRARNLFVQPGRSNQPALK